MDALKDLNSVIAIAIIVTLISVYAFIRKKNASDYNSSLIL